jgi:cytochrome b
LGLHRAYSRSFLGLRHCAGGALRYERDLVLLRSERHLGHSPARGVMVVLFLAPTVVAGLIMYGGYEQAGPLAGVFTRETGEGRMNS